MPVTSSRASTSWSPAGAVYMPIPDAPVKEIMKDMMEMSRAVQHLARGLFPRHYLSGQMRDNLPVATTKARSETCRTQSHSSSPTSSR
ncbi:hypothetical protein M0805_006622 [Coniferiporia weirii]|nr:hypothetical protein M0805_006622 [Coniferiporia weirii]